MNDEKKVKSSRGVSIHISTAPEIEDSFFSMLYLCVRTVEVIVEKPKLLRVYYVIKKTCRALVEH